MFCFSPVVKMARGIVAIIFVLATVTTSFALTAEEQTAIERDYDEAGHYEAMKKIAEEDMIYNKRKIKNKSSANEPVEFVVLNKLKIFFEKKRAQFQEVALDPEKDLLIEEILSNFDFEYMIETVSSVTIQQIKSVIVEAGLTTEVHEDVLFALNSNHTDIFISNVSSILGRSIKANIGRSFKNVYGEYYTLDELKTIAAFYRTSAGRKSAHLSRSVVEKMIEVGMSNDPFQQLAVAAELEQALEDYATKLELEKSNSLSFN